MTFSDIATLCRTVSSFGHKQNFTFKALPVIAWEFADPDQFLAARAMLARAVLEEQPYVSRDAVRETGPFTVEIDCAAVTFRLECRHYRFMPDGSQKGIAELKPGTDYIENPHQFPGRPII